VVRPSEDTRSHTLAALRRGLDSSHGTLVNDRRVRDAEVRAGDRIRLVAAGFTL
jgi:pSer/pThr/pTyr-binding forkhead associated (FHA) protein